MSYPYNHGQQRPTPGYARPRVFEDEMSQAPTLAGDDLSVLEPLPPMHNFHAASYGSNPSGSGRIVLSNSTESGSSRGHHEQSGVYSSNSQSMREPPSGYGQEVPYASKSLPIDFDEEDDGLTKPSPKRNVRLPMLIAVAVILVAGIAVGVVLALGTGNKNNSTAEASKVEKKSLELDNSSTDDYFTNDNNIPREVEPRGSEESEVEENTAEGGDNTKLEESLFDNLTETVDNNDGSTTGESGGDSGTEETTIEFNEGETTDSTDDALDLFDLFGGDGVSFYSGGFGTDLPTTSPPGGSPVASPTVTPVATNTDLQGSGGSTSILTDSPTTTSNPTGTPVSRPTPNPTSEPTLPPVPDPTSSPTLSPVAEPTSHPTINPTPSPTKTVTKNPTVSPTSTPTSHSVTGPPTTSPTVAKTDSPTHTPTVNPTKAPVAAPMSQPEPTRPPKPTRKPTFKPTVI